MNWLERKIGWIAFPSIIRYLALFQLGVLGLTFLNKGANQLLDFNWTAIMSGEVWRLFTFVFVPVGSLSGSGGSMSAIFAVFAALLLMSFSDGLETRWGVFRTTVYFIGGWLTCLLVSIFFSVTDFGLLGISNEGYRYTVVNSISPGILFDLSILFAFATYHPKYEIRLFFILPVPIAILAALSGLWVLMVAFSRIPFFIYVLGCLLPYFIIAVPLLFSASKREARKVNIKQKSDKPESFHTCENCGKKDSDDSSAYFRVTTDGKELCNECLKSAKTSEN